MKTDFLVKLEAFFKGQQCFLSIPCFTQALPSGKKTISCYFKKKKRKNSNSSFWQNNSIN